MLTSHRTQIGARVYSDHPGGARGRMPGLLTLIGSGEVSAGMSRVHRHLLGRLGAPARPAFLDTPAGFELGAEAIAGRFRDYFRQRFDLPLAVVVHRRADDDPQALAAALQALATRNYILAGPGSPTYAARQWRASAVYRLVVERWQAGAQLVFSSSAAIAIGAWSLPVYEIYKVGQDLHWVEGANLLGPFGLNLAIVTHWDNAEGGTHDTRACFIGLDRFERLRSLLPAETVVLGIDEHTACTLDIPAGTAEVRGKGGVVILSGGQSTRRERGATFPLTELQPPGRGAAWAAPGPERTAAPPDALALAATHFAEGRLSAGLRAAAWVARPDVAVLLHQAARALDDELPCDENEAQLLDLLIQLRTDLRAAREWDLADRLRQGLLGLGYELHDTPEATTWEKKSGPGQA